MRCVVPVARIRRLVGLLTLLALIVIVVGVSGFELPLPRIGGGTTDRAALAGVRAVAADMLVRVGSSAPPGGELAFMAVEPSGNLVVSDSKRRTLMRFDSTGHLLSEWGPRFADAQLTEPAGVAVSNDGYYVIDRGTPRILHIDAAGQLRGIFNLEPLSPYGLNGLAVDQSGNLYAADTGRNRILVFSPNGQLIKQVGRGGADLGGFTQPMMLAFAPDGSFFVADFENNRVERWDASFEATNAWSTGFHSFGIAVDPTGRVFVPDTDHRRVEVFSPQGATLGEMGAPSTPTIDVSPRQVAIARAGQPSVFVLGNDGIQRLDLENTAPPPQGGSTDVDLVSLAALALMAALLALAVLSRRQRRATASLGAALDRPVGLQPENGAQREHQQPHADEHLLIANQTKREQ
jgi:DNA-binding beta-propeller fold protein YncE